MTPVSKPRLWPRDAIGPLGNRATFHCMSDVPHGWVLEHPLPGEPAQFVVTHEDDGMRHPFDPPNPPKNKGGRPRKVAP